MARLRRIRLGDDETDERWLQQILFEAPDLVPMEQIDPGAGMLIPLCREFQLQSASRAVRLDILGVSSRGRLVLIECKRWDNPESRREVIAQILEYAALLRGWSYGDLTAQLISQGRAARGTRNPIYDRACNHLEALDEARFVDAVSLSLMRGEFDLIVAGDGIRPEVEPIASYLQGATAMVSRIALVEFQIWGHPNGDRTVIPALRLGTELVEHRVVTDANGIPLALQALGEEDELDTRVDPERAEARRRNRVFWQKFIDDLILDHPDQPGPRHGGNNYVTLEMPDPAERLVAYRTHDGEIGVFFRLRGQGAAQRFEELRAESSAVEREIGSSLRFDPDSPRARWTVGTATELPAAAPDGERMQAEWLSRKVNAFVNAFRRRLS